MRMKIRAMLYVVGVLWLAVISQLAVSRIFMDDSRIMDAFTDTNTNIEESKLNLVVDYGDGFISNNERQDVLRKLADTVGVTDYTITTEKADAASTMRIQEKSKGVETTIEFISVTQPLDEKETTYNHFILMQMEMDEDFGDIVDYKKSVEKSIKSLDVKDYQCIMKFTGSYEGELTDKEKDAKVRQLLKNLQAKTVESITSNSFYTTYAYTGLIDDYIEAAGKRININVAISYDEEEDETEIYLATPILNEEY